MLLSLLFIPKVEDHQINHTSVQTVMGKTVLPKSMRAPAGLPRKVETLKPKRVVASLSVNFSTLDLALPSHLKVPLGLVAIPKKKYDSSMGKVLWSSARHVIIASENPEHEGNVIYDKNKKSFFPIGSIISLANVDSEKREAILGLGFEEYHYRSQAKLLYIKSLDGEVMRSYQSLREAGFEPELEIMRDFNRPR